MSDNTALYFDKLRQALFDGDAVTVKILEGQLMGVVANALLS